jgi:hypothetical protein
MATLMQCLSRAFEEGALLLYEFTDRDWRSVPIADALSAAASAAPEPGSYEVAFYGIARTWRICDQADCPGCVDTRLVYRFRHPTEDFPDLRALAPTPTPSPGPPIISPSVWEWLRNPAL